MTVRRATEADEATLRELWQEFEHELPGPEHFDPEPWEDEWRDTRRDLEHGFVFLAEDDDEGPVGVARASAPQQGAAHVHLVYVRPHARRQGVTKELLRALAEEARERGARTLSLHVQTSNEDARTVWRKLGFEDMSFLMAAPLEALELRLAGPIGPSEGAVYVQTDDEGRVAASAERFLPRLGRPEGTQVAPTGTGWIAVREPLLDRDPKLLRTARAGALAD